MLSSISNYYEQLVLDTIYQALAENRRALNDQTYIDDLACIALNRLPARYIRHSVDLVAHIPDDEHTKMRSSVIEAVDHALRTIRRRESSRTVE
jgi:hypothetical protein